jgi:hypothetical protein
MSDTIELLEAIGRDASFRHASPEELKRLLERAEASEALKAAAESGDAARLSAEFGPKPMLVPQSTQTFHEGEEPAEDEPLPSPDPDQLPPQP